MVNSIFFFFPLLSLLVGFPSAAEQCFLRSSTCGSGEETKQLVVYLGVNGILSVTFSQDRNRQGELWDLGVAAVGKSAEIKPIS